MGFVYRRIERVDDKVIPESTDKSARPQKWLDSAERVSRTVSIAAIPVVLAVGGWVIQRQLQNQTVSRDYVQLAVTILGNPDKSKVRPELREWAVNLLDDNSPTKLNAKAKASLASGEAMLPSFQFVPSSALTPDLQQSLQSALEEFQEYLVRLGFDRISGPPVSVKILPGTTFKLRGADWAAAWEDETQSIAVASAFANDKVVVLRELAHRYLSSNLSPSGAPPAQGGAIESGLATYLPCSFTGNPLVGAETSGQEKDILPPQNLRNSRRFSEIQLHKWASVQTDGSEVWGGAFWQVRQILGQDRADPLLAATWRGLSPESLRSTSAYAAFAADLIRRSSSIENGKYTGQIRAAFEQRGLNF